MNLFSTILLLFVAAIIVLVILYVVDKPSETNPTFSIPPPNIPTNNQQINKINQQIDVNEIAKATRKSAKQINDREISQEDDNSFHMPKFNVSGMFDHSNVSKSAPKYTTFSGFNRSEMRGVSVLTTENELEDMESDDSGVLKRGERLQRGARIQPRMTLAMRMMSDSDQQKWMDPYNTENKQTSAAAEVLNSINERKERSKKEE